MSSDQYPAHQPLPRRTLAQQMADELTEAIVSGEMPPGSMLPIEPLLAARFGVSRAVVRDATRMLVARGLVDARHGRGVFVTESGMEPFSEALLLALRRQGATVWDLERFEALILPEVMAEAARMATDDDIALIRRLTEKYHATFAEVSRRNWGKVHLPEIEREQTLAAFRAVYRAIFAATHNAVLRLLAEPVLRLRALRSWQEGDLTVEEFIAHERRLFDRRIEAIAGRDPERARAVARASAQMPAAVEAALRDVMTATPIGETVEVPLTLSAINSGDE
jgi:DNA-binding FadR family transcriptional regulator